MTAAALATSALLALVGGAGEAAPPKAVAARLEAVAPVERSLRGGEQHDYAVALAAGHYLDASLAPHGVTVLFTLHAPEGKVLFEETLPGGTGPKSIEWVAEGAGKYRLEVRSTSIALRQGRYRLELRARREATVVDRKRFATRLALEEGEAQFVGKNLPRRDIPQARVTFERALALAREAGARDLEARAYQWLGHSHREGRDLGAAAEALGQAYELRKDLGDYQKGDALLALGLLARTRRDYQQALRHDLEAIELFRRVGARVSEARGFQYLANVYNDLGDPDKALAAQGNAVDIWKEEGLFVDQAQALTSLGRFHYALGQAGRALGCHRRAEAIARREKSDERLADAFTDLGLTHRLLAENASAAPDRKGHYRTSLRYLEQGLEIHNRLKARGGRLLTLRGLRRTHASRGDWEEALGYSAQILDSPGGDGWPEFTAVAAIALRRGRIDEARDWIEEAAAAVEATRPVVSDYDLQASYEGTLSSLFDLQVDVLMRLHEREPAAGFDWAAFQASERGRARALLDNIRASQGQGAGPARPDLAPREKELAQAAEDLRSRAAPLAPGSAERTRLEADLVKTLAEREDVRRGLRQNVLTRVAPPSLAEIQGLLDEETLLLEYDLAEARSYLFAIGKRSWRTVTLPAEAKIDAQVRRLPEALARRLLPGGRRAADRAFEIESAALSELILGGVRPDPAVKRLVFVCDGALYYVPVAGLPLPRTWAAPEPGAKRALLVSRYEIATLPAASLVAVLDRARAGRQRPAKRLAIFADPVFGAGDARLNPGGNRARPAQPGPAPPRLGVMSAENLARLPHTARLAEEALRGLPAEEGFAALGFAATREAALSPALADYSMVVFATHSYLDEAYPALSGIALSAFDEAGQPRDGFLRQHDVYGMRLNADLVVLAGCQTALGKRIRGEGLLGLSRGFFYAGASRVVASLWNVEEMATMKLISEFLRRSQQEGQTYAAALREAQLTLARDPRWRAPYFWAGFVVQGDWR